MKSGGRKQDTMVVGRIADIRKKEWGPNAKGQTGVMNFFTLQISDDMPPVEFPVTLGKNVANYAPENFPSVHTVNPGDKFEVMLAGDPISLALGTVVVVNNIMWNAKAYERKSETVGTAGEMVYGDEARVYSNSITPCKVDGPGGKKINAVIAQSSSFLEQGAEVPPLQEGEIPDGARMGGQLRMQPGDTITTTGEYRNQAGYHVEFNAEIDGKPVSVLLNHFGRYFAAEFGFGLTPEPLLLADAFSAWATLFIGRMRPVVVGQNNASKTDQNEFAGMPRVSLRYAQFIAPNTDDYASVGIEISQLQAAESISMLDAEGPDPFGPNGQRTTVLFGRHGNTKGYLSSRDGARFFLVPRVQNLRAVLNEGENGVGRVLERVRALPEAERPAALFAAVQTDDAAAFYSPSLMLLVVQKPSDVDVGARAAMALAAKKVAESRKRKAADAEAAVKRQKTEE